MEYQAVDALANNECTTLPPPGVDFAQESMVDSGFLGTEEHGQGQGEREGGTRISIASKQTYTEVKAEKK